ncbi:Hypothetical protein FKW44_015181 [Caligus rogercresseyi]|uniref:Uncharacterized protein n=1 Tax=Caligus rogercresseyi TaxID=217165 RepID=A0A7T8GZZ0_CALRO|nr:Hypothetical protein FKW44_015181 [Caligus rogercresseyi]
MSSELSAGRPLLWRSVAAVPPRRSSTSSNSQSYCLQHCQVLQGVGGHRGRIPNTEKKDSRPIPSQEEERRLH